MDEAQEAALDEDTHQADGRAAGAHPHEEVPGVLRHAEADIAAHQVHATVCQVGDAHQAEDKGKAAGDQKEEGGEGQAVEDLEQQERRIHRPSSVVRAGPSPSRLARSSQKGKPPAYPVNTTAPRPSRVPCWSDSCIAPSSSSPTRRLTTGRM